MDDVASFRFLKILEDYRHGMKITETQATPHKNTNPSRLQIGIPQLFYVLPECGQRTLFFVDHIGLQELSKIAGISKYGILLDWCGSTT